MNAFPSAISDASLTVPLEPAECHWDRMCRRLVCLLVIFGTACRVAQYAAQRSYWHDEALVVMNVLDKTPGQLMGPLSYSQAAPPMFLWAEKAMASMLGASEWSLRSISLAAGVLSLVGFAVLAWRLMPRAAPWVVGWFALSDRLIWHSAEVKQYSSDVFMAVLLLFLAVGWRTKLSPLARFMRIGVVAAVGIWFSHTAIFLFGAISVMVLAQVGRNLRRIGVWLAVNAGVAASFVCLYRYSIRFQHDPYLVTFWAEAFVDYGRWYLLPVWLARQTFGLLDHPIQSFGVLFLIMAVAGVVGWRRAQGGRLLMVGVGPIGLTAAAACLHQYPYTGDRVTLYLVPGVFLLAGAGLEWLRREERLVCWIAHPGLRRWWWLVLALPPVAVAAGEASQHLLVPRSRSHIRPVVQYVQERRQAGEAVYVIGEGPDRSHPDLTSGMCLEFLCYWRHPPQPLHTTMPTDLRIPEKRFWVVFAFLPRHKTGYMEGLLKRLREQAAEKDRIIVNEGGAGFLFESGQFIAPRGTED